MSDSTPGPDPDTAQFDILGQLVDEPSGAESEDSDSADAAERDGVGEPGTVDSDDDFAPSPRPKLSRLSIGLIAVLLITAAFVGGALYQKNHTGATATGFPAGAQRAGLPGFAGGGEGGFGGQSGTGAPTGTGGTATAATPSVIGTVESIAGADVVVRNLGGTSITVHTTAATTISSTIALGGLAVGQTVVVTGSAEADTSVTATAIGIRA